MRSGDNLVRMLPACEGREKENFPDPDNAGCKDAKGQENQELSVLGSNQWPQD